MASSTDHEAAGGQVFKDATVDEVVVTQPRDTQQEYERLFGVDEDAYDQPTTTRKELWSYYLYYNGMIQSWRSI